VAEERTDIPFQLELAAETLEHVECAGQSRVEAERYESVVLLVRDQFVVDQAHVAVDEVPQHAHVLRLSLESMRKDELSFARYNILFGEFLQTHYDRRC